MEGFAAAFPSEAALAPDLLTDLDRRLAALAPAQERILSGFAGVVVEHARLQAQSRPPDS